MAAHKGMLLVLRDSATGLSKQGLPWGIEGEPEGIRSFNLKKPFEANSKGNAVGYTGHYKNEPAHI